MKIAVIGWGSLIWCPGPLAIKTAWDKNGPELPIEFARISKDRRLTLVIHPGSMGQKTYWALSALDDLECARENPRQRENCCKEAIHYVTANGRCGEGAIVATIRQWIKSKDLGAVVWAGLESNWKDRKGKEFAAEDAVNYLTCLRKADLEAFKRAKEYVRNAPPQIQTEVRKRLKKISGKDWSDSPLPKILFV